MRKVVAIACLAPALLLGACQQTTQERRATQGAVLGAAAGGIIGGAVSGTGYGVATGAAIGAASGAILGAVTTRPGYCYARDANGRTVVVRCPPGY